MNTDGFIHPVVMVLTLKVKKLAQSKCRLILPQIGCPEGLQGYEISGLQCQYQHQRTPFPSIQIIFPILPIKNRWR